MQQRRMNNWKTVSDRGINALRDCRVSILRALKFSILLETFSDERLINHRGYDDASIPLKR